jgi:hypothetical protein
MVSKEPCAIKTLTINRFICLETMLDNSVPRERQLFMAMHAAARPSNHLTKQDFLPPILLFLGSPMISNISSTNQETTPLEL